MKPYLLLLCLLCGCGQTPDKDIDALSDKAAEMNYLQGVHDGMKLTDDIQQRLVNNEAEARAMMNQRKTNWLATRPTRLTP